MNAGQDILIKSGAGNIDASCLNDIRINSRGDGSVSASIHRFAKKLFPRIQIESMVSRSVICLPQMETNQKID